MRTGLAVVPLLLVVACSGSDDTGGSDGTSNGELPGLTVTGSVGEPPKITVKDLEVDEQRSAVVVEGDGPAASTQGQLLLHLVIVRGDTGEQVLSTFDAGHPVPVRAESEPVIGLLDALDGQPRGSRVAFESTAEDAFGAGGAPAVQLGPDDSLVVVADIISVQPTDVLDGPEGAAVAPPAGAPVVQTKGDRVTGLDWSGTPKEAGKSLQVIPLIQGTGPAIAAERLVTFDYASLPYRSDGKLSGTMDREPVTFPVGIDGLIDAWDEGLVGVKEGSRVMIIAPPDKAYGPEGDPPDIPPNATLVFVIDVLGVDG